MTTQLLYISIGPVQEFIASARRCQDLWYGSYLLSQLSECCAEAIEVALQASTNTSQKAMIFPAELSHVSSMESMVANKILFELNNMGHTQAKHLAAVGQKAVAQRLQQEQDIAFKRVLQHRFFNREMAEQQLSELIEFAWVFMPVSSYPRARKDADSVLAARKMSKQWSQITWNQGLEVPKSSLDGARESVIYDDAFDRDKGLSPEERRKLFGLKSNERLCGVGLLKRLGAILETDHTTNRLRPAFHSTSHIAAAPLLTALHDPREGSQRREAVQTYLQRLRELGLKLDEYKVRTGQNTHAKHIKSVSGQPVDRVFAQEERGAQRPLGFDGYLLFESRLEEVVEESGVEASDRATLTQSAREALRTCLQSFHLSPDHVCKYYAVILADGDHMGSAIDAMQTPDQHRALSTQLESFARGCRELVEGYGGSLIYAGGDDVLALAPLHTALDLAHHLKDHFELSLKSFFTQPEIKALIKDAPTLSVGLSVAHHLDSMSYALNLARRAERNAKEAGRNALSILVSRRSGGDYQATGSWTEKTRAPLHKRLEELVTLTHQEALPHGVAHELLEALKRFAPLQEHSLSAKDKATWQTTIRAPLWREVKRILERKKIDNGRSDAIAARQHILTSLEGSGDALSEHVLQLCDELLIAKLIAGAERCAWPNGRPNESATPSLSPHTSRSPA